MTAAQSQNSSGKTAYDVSRPLGKCYIAGETISPGEKFMAALRETPAGFERLDISLDAWKTFDRKDVSHFGKA